MKDVFFVRHAQSESNVDTVARGHSTKLSEKGIGQAKAVAGRVANLSVEALLSSPFTRTQHTAEYISEAIGLPIELNQLFIERRNSSKRIGRALHEPEIKKMEQEIFDGYAIPGYRHSDEENFDELKERSLAALDFLANHPKDRLCVVTHGVFLRVLHCAAVHGTAFTGREMQNCIHHLETDNTGIFYFTYVPNPWAKEGEPTMEWRIKSWNDLSHFG